MNKKTLTALLILILGSPVAFATNGYFMIGYGAKSIGLAGAGVALPQDRLVGALNPAGVVQVADGYDAGLRVLAGIRNGSVDCRGIGACDAVIKDRSARDLFAIPNFGWKRQLDEDLAIGVSVYGNGGINTTFGRAFYDEALARILGGTPGTPGFPRDGKIGVDFSQLFIAPTLSWQPHAAHAIGISPILAVQRFSARGFESFARLSADPGSVTGRGTDYTLGGGFRVGWIAQLTPELRFGAQYTSRIWTKKSTKYNGLLADNGSMEAPSHWTVGLAYALTERLTLVFDYQQIAFNSIGALSNPGPTAVELLGMITPERRLGADDGIGFGWTDESVFKIGAAWRATDRLTLRTGWNHGSSQIPNAEALMNIIAPATINDNATIGGSWDFPGLGELSFSYMYAFKKTHHDRSSAFFGTAIRHSIYEHALDVSWSRNF